MKPLLLILFLLLTTIHATHTLAQTKEEARQTIHELREKKQYLDALVLAEHMLVKYPSDVVFHITRAFLNDARGQRVLAFQNLFEAEQKFPNNDTVISSLCHLYQFSGMLDSALACHTRCLNMAKTDRDRYSANINIGSVYLNQQAYAKAIAHYEKMIRSYPDSLSIQTNLAQAYADNNQKDKAVIIMEGIIKKDPTFDGAYNNLGLLYTEMGNYPAANNTFKKGIAAGVDDAYLLNNYGYLRYKMKDYNNALLYINKSIALYNTNPYAYRNRALVYLDMKLLKEACSDLDASTELGFKIYYGDEVEQLKAKHCKS